MLLNSKSFLEGNSTRFSEENETLSSLLTTLLSDGKDDQHVCAKLGQTELKICELVVATHRIATSLPSCSLIAVCMQPSLELIIVLCGIIKRGIAYIPIEPTLPFERIKYILNDSQAQLIIVDHVSLFTELIDIKIASYSQLCANVIDIDNNKVVQVNNTDTFCLMYTSGSTGQPKGVHLSHRALLNRLYWQWSCFPFNKDDVCCFKTSISFVDSIAEIFAPLFRQIPVIIIPKSLLLDIDQFIPVLSMEHITRIVLVPSLLTIILNYLANKNIKLFYLSLIVCSGETLPLTLVELFLASKHIFCSSCRLLNLYGSTEVMADVTCQVFDSSDGLYDMLSLDGRMSIGYPIDNMRVDIVELDENGIGELVVTGPGVANGYQNTNIALSRKFICDNDGRLHFRTGDLAKIWNNRIFLYGRTDTQLKIAGNRIDLNEIAFTLIQHCNCRQPMVMYLANISQIVVFLQENEKPIDFDRGALSKRLPLYAIPTKFVTVPTFPLLVSGKVNGQELINSFNMAQQIGQDKQKIEQKSNIDQAFFDILAEFGISPSDANRNFIAAGGSSLIAISLVAKLHRIGFHDLSVERLMKTNMLRDILLYESDDNQPNSDLFFENKHDYQVIPLEQVDKDEAIRIITESFVNLSEFDVLIHHNRQDLKLQCQQDWFNLLNQLWEYHVASGLSYGITVNNKYLVGIALSNDTSQEPHIDFTNILRLIPVFTMIETGEKELLDELRSHNALPQRILRSILTAVNPDLQPEERLKFMYYLEHEVLQMAASKQFQAVITANVNSVTQQLVEHVFQYDIRRAIYVNQSRDSSGTLLFPNAQDKYFITINMKYII